MAHHLIFSPRSLALSACFNPVSVNCSVCSPTEMTLGTCTVLADSPAQANLGAVTAWGMFLCFLILPAGLITRRTRLLWAGLTPIWGIILAAILQDTIPSIRPIGACMGIGVTCGMPSGHVITSYSTISFLFLMWGRDLRLKGLKQCISDMSTFFGVFLILIVSAFVTIQILMPVGRVFIKYHTSAQVGFGVLTGCLIGAFWFLLVLKFLGPKLGPWMERRLCCNDDWTHAGEQFKVKDSQDGEVALVTAASRV